MFNPYYFIMFHVSFHFMPLCIESSVSLDPATAMKRPADDAEEPAQKRAAVSTLVLQLGVSIFEDLEVS